MRRAAVALVVLAALAAAGAWKSTGATPRAVREQALSAPMLALERGPQAGSLVRVDPKSLRLIGRRRLNVGLAGSAWSFSTDRSRLALGDDGGGRFVPELLLVDASRLRSLGRVRLAPSGWTVASAWLPDGRVVGVVSSTRVDVVTVDAARGTVVASRRFEGQIEHAAHSADGLVLLLAPDGAIGPARLVVLRPSGALDVVTLERVSAGTRRSDRSGGSEFRTVQPGLAVDPEGRRAFVVPAAGDVAVVGLDDLAVSYRAVSQRRSLAARLVRWLEPSAQAKSIAGPARHARWLGGGLIAVSGGDYAVTASGRPTFAPAGVRLIDTRDWSASTLAPGTDTFRRAGDLLLATSSVWSSELEQPRPVGLLAYDLDGRRRFRLYDGQRAWIAHADGRRAYVDPYGPGPVGVIDLATGRVVERRASVPRPLAGVGEPAL